MLDDPKLQQATARVTHGGETCGTAWYCGDGLCLTAAHVVGDLNDTEVTRRQVTLAFPSGEVTATACDEDADFTHDIAVLRINGHAERLEGVAPIPIADPVGKSMPPPTAWRAWGFPHTHEQGLMLRGEVVTLTGRSARGVPAIQLHTHQGPFSGLVNVSGSALIVDGIAIGVVVEYTPALERGALFAAPLREGPGGLAALQPLLLRGCRDVLTERLRQHRAAEAARGPGPITQITADHGSVAILGDNHAPIILNNR